MCPRTRSLEDRALHNRPVIALAVLALLTGVLVAPTSQAEPKLQLRVGREPYYAGVPVEIHVQATGFERAPEPTCTAPQPGSGRLQLIRIVPSFSSSMQIVNGRVTRSEVVSFTCQFQFTSGKSGPHRVGPFRVEQSGVTRDTQPYALNLKKVPQDSRVRIRVLVSSQGPIFVGQHVPVTIEWWVGEALQDKIASYSIRSALFDRDDAFRFINEQLAQRGDQALAIETAPGEISLRATVDKRSADGESYLVLSATRTMVPMRSGEYDLDPATVNIDQVTGWKRDLFGGRRPSQTRRLFASDEPRRLVVMAPPAADRPESFAGAVGRGFSLEVTADRSVVQLGDPITLSLTVRGDGNLANVSLPSLEGPGGLDPKSFRLPSTEVGGETHDDAKRFKLSVRVLDDSVREIPAIDYSWFDPELMEYQTTSSRPIALSVRPAEVISAEDVVTATPLARSPEPGEEEATGSEEDHAGNAPALSGSFSLTGADLSIEERVDRLSQRTRLGSAAIASVYGISIAALAGAFFARRRADADPTARRHRELYADQRRRILAARSRPLGEAMAEISAGLREITNGAPELRSDEVDRFIQECDAVIYSPDTRADTPLDPDLSTRVEALVDAMKDRLA